jgi:hypothetical protein
MPPAKFEQLWKVIPDKDFLRYSDRKVEPDEVLGGEK